MAHKEKARHFTVFLSVRAVWLSVSVSVYLSDCLPGIRNRTFLERVTDISGYFNHLCRSDGTPPSCNCRPTFQCKQPRQFWGRTWVALEDSPCCLPSVEIQNTTAYWPQRHPVTSGWLAVTHSNGRCFSSRRGSVALFVLLFRFFDNRPVWIWNHEKYTWNRNYSLGPWRVTVTREGDNNSWRGITTRVGGLQPGKRGGGGELYLGRRMW